MELLEYNDLLLVLKDVSKRQKVGKFITTGRIHQGHIEGIKKAKENSDKVVVIFNSYFPLLFFQVTGQESGDYSKYQEEDLKVLEFSGLVDFVSERKWELSMLDEVTQLRKLVLSDRNLLENLGHLENKEEKTLPLVSLALRQNPDEQYCDSVWIGDKNPYMYLSMLLARRYRIPLKYHFYPVVKDKDGLVIDSRYLTPDYATYVIRKEGAYYINQAKIQLLKSGKLPELGLKNFVVSLTRLEDMKKVKEIELGQKYLFFGHYSKEVITYFDVERVEA